MPVLAKARTDVLAMIRGGASLGGAVEGIVESDPGLAMAVIHRANQRVFYKNVATVPQALLSLGPAEVELLTTTSVAFDFFGEAGSAIERFYSHAVAVQRMARRLSEVIDYGPPHELLLAALIHDIGKLWLLQGQPGYPEQIHQRGQTPEQRLSAERAALGVDHAELGADIARAQKFPERLVAAIALHHTSGAVAHSSLIRLADMLEHYQRGQPIDLEQLSAAATATGIERSSLSTLVYETAHSLSTPRTAQSSPLTPRETDILGHLAEGKVYKEIALELSLSASTVRNHLHHAYDKLGVADRAQAVLVATERGWLQSRGAAERAR